METKQYKILENGKKITCAVVMINRAGDILGCHGFGKDIDRDYDFPKGCAEEGESDKFAAARELAEETNIYLYDPTTNNGYNLFDKMIDCGIHHHNKEKDIHIFLYKMIGFPDIDDLKCKSFFEDENGNSHPEMDGYMIIKKNERHKFMKVLQDKFDIIDKFNK